MEFFGGNSVRERPPAPKSIGRQRRVRADFCGGFADGHDSVVGLNEHIGPSISGLLCGRGPTAVTRLVAAIVVNPINRGAVKVRWLHVLNKVLKSQPALTNDDTARSVSNKILAGRLCASLNHVGPSTPERMRSCKSALRIAEATAGYGVVHKISASDFGIISAITPTAPDRIPSFGRAGRQFHDHQTPNSLASHVDKSWHEHHHSRPPMSRQQTSNATEKYP